MSMRVSWRSRKNEFDSRACPYGGINRSNTQDWKFHFPAGKSGQPHPSRAPTFTQVLKNVFARKPPFPPALAATQPACTEPNLAAAHPPASKQDCAHHHHGGERKKASPHIAPPSHA